MAEMCYKNAWYAWLDLPSDIVQYKKSTPGQLSNFKSNSDLIAGQSKLDQIVRFITYLSHEEVSKLETICGTDVITNLTNSPLGDMFWFMRGCSTLWS